jgi:hypothetical protein
MMSVTSEVVAVWVLAMAVGTGLFVGGASHVLAFEMLFAVSLLGLTIVASRAMCRLILIITAEEATMIGQQTWVELRLRMQDEADAAEEAVRLLIAVRLGGG